MTNNFKGYFKSYLIDYITIKEKQGFSTRGSLMVLKNFDAFTIDKNISNFTKDLIDDYVNFKKNTIKPQSLADYISKLRSFSIFLSEYIDDTYVIPVKYYRHNTGRYIPHIYNKEEVLAIFKIIKNYGYAKDKYNIKLEIIFNLLYGTGMRIGEVLNLKISDVNFDDGSIFIRNSKGHKSRMIYMADSLKIKIKKLYSLLPSGSKNDYFIRNRANNKIEIGYIEKIFRKIIKQTGIQFKIQPKIHGFRHLFAINTLNDYIKKNKNVNELLPILQVYMGHTNLADTVYYLRLIPDMFDVINANTLSKLEHLIPDIEVENE